MGAEWPAGAALAMESWPARSRGFMSGVLQGSWSLGFLLASLLYGLAFNAIGWRGLLMIGVLPAFVVVYVRLYVKEPPVWQENRRQQRAEKREVHAPLLNIFKPGLLGNTLTACWWMASSFLVYYSINALFATHLQKDLKLEPGGWSRRRSCWRTSARFSRMGSGAGSRTLRPPLVDDHPGGDRDLCRPPLSADY